MTDDKLPRKPHHDVVNLTTLAICVGMTGSGKDAMPQKLSGESISTYPKLLLRSREFQQRKYEVSRQHQQS